MTQGACMVVARPRCLLGVTVESQVRVDRYAEWHPLGATCSLLPATSTSRKLAADRSWGAVPIMTTSDLSALSCRSLRKNHSRTAVEQLASFSRAGPASATFMATSSCVSSANWWYETPWDSMSSPTGDTYAVKSSGPSTDPWGTPDAHCVAVDKWSPSFTNCCLSGQIFLSFCHNWRVLQTDGETDGRTDRPSYIQCSAVKINKNGFEGQNITWQWQAVSYGLRNGRCFSMLRTAIMQSDAYWMKADWLSILRMVSNLNMWCEWRAGAYRLGGVMGCQNTPQLRSSAKLWSIYCKTCISEYSKWLLSVAF